MVVAFDLLQDTENTSCQVHFQQTVNLCSVWIQNRASSNSGVYKESHRTQGVYEVWYIQFGIRLQ